MRKLGASQNRLASICGHGSALGWLLNTGPEFDRSHNQNGGGAVRYCCFPERGIPIA